MRANASSPDPFLFNEYPRTVGNSSLIGKTLHSSILGAGVKTIITGGQSNMATSVGTTPYSVVSPNALMLNIYDGGIYSGGDPVLGCNVGGVSISSVNMAIADSMISRGKATTCVVVPVAMGGTPFAVWEPTTDSTLFGRITTAILRCRARNLEPDAFFWGEGETDNNLGTSAAAIKASIWAIVDAIRAAPISCVAPFYVGQYTMNAGVASTAVRAGIANSVDASRGIVLGYDADVNLTVAGGYRLGDGTHLSNLGRDTSATGWTTLAFP